MPSTPPREPRRSGAGALTLFAVLAFVALAAFLLMRRESPPVADVPAPTVAPAPSLAPPSDVPPSAAVEAVAEPSPEASPAPEGASPAPAPAGEPRPRRRPAGSTASGPRTADSGTTSVGTRLPPPPPPLTPAAGGRRFVLGASTVESLKPVTRDIAGFEAAGVGVKRAPQVNGRVVLEMDPPEMRPGVDYTVKVYLANDGDREIAVQGLTLVTVENGKTTSRTPAPAARTVRPKQRALVHEFAGVWREAARSWALEATVTSARQDVYKNRLSWQ
jgi:hypothetical protein